MLYAGVDTHKKYSRVVVTDGRGQMVAQASLSNDIASFKDFFLKMNEPLKAVVEAGRTWGIIYDMLEDLGAEPVLANPLKTRAIASDKLCEVNFNNVYIPIQNVLGEVNKGWQDLKTTLRKAAIFKCAESIGGMQACVDMTVAYSKERVQYNRPIGAFQALQHIIADMWIAMQTARYLVYEVGWLESNRLNCDKEASMAKSYTNEAYKFVSKWGIRIHGGIGTSREHDISLYYRRAKAADIAYGGTDFHLEKVAQEIGLLK